MSSREPELLLLHALPLDGSMWAGQMEQLPGSTYAPTLYALGDSVEEWAAEALKLAKGNRLIVVGCSVGGSCALELAAIAPDRVAALVLIGTKAAHRPDPELHVLALETIQQKGLEEDWNVFWAPLFSSSADSRIVDHAKRMALRQSPQDIARGVTAFHSRPDRGQLLSVISCPVVIVTGADDRAPGPAISAAQARLAASRRPVLRPLRPSGAAGGSAHNLAERDFLTIGEISQGFQRLGCEHKMGLDFRTESELCSFFVLLERDMIRSLIEEAAALTSLALFIGMVVIWAQVIATL